MDYESSRIIDSNGTKYRVGWDEYGWFTVETVEPHPETGEWMTMEGTDLVSFNPSGAKELIEAIEEGL